MKKMSLSEISAKLLTLVGIDVSLLDLLSSAIKEIDCRLKKLEKSSEMIDEETCWCPCGCGWNEPDLMYNGLCECCYKGAHEVPPEGVYPGVKELLIQHQRIVAQFQKVLKNRKKSL